MSSLVEQAVQVRPVAATAAEQRIALPVEAIWRAALVLHQSRNKSSDRIGICCGMAAERNVEAQGTDTRADARAEALEASSGVFSS